MTIFRFFPNDVLSVCPSLYRIQHILYWNIYTYTIVTIVVVYHIQITSGELSWSQVLITSKVSFSKRSERAWGDVAQEKTGILANKNMVNWCKLSILYIIYIHCRDICIYIYIILFTIQVMKMILYPHSIHHYVSLVDFVPCMVIEMVIDLDNERF